MQNKHVLLVIIVIVALNAWRLQGKFKQGETASYDGDERPVTETDVLIARAFTVVLIVAYLYSLWATE